MGYIYPHLGRIDISCYVWELWQHICLYPVDVYISLPEPAVPLPPPFNVQEHEVRTLFKQQSSRKAAGHDNVFTSTLKHCANELSPVFMDLFSSSLRFKAAIIIHVRKKTKVKAPNDYFVVVTVLEQLTVLTHLKSVTNSKMDPLQFAYRDNRCTDDVGALALHFVMQHLESPNIYARILLVDYRSVFNTVIPQKLFDKLHLLSLDASMGYWILHFLCSDHRLSKWTVLRPALASWPLEFPRDKYFI